MRLPGISLIGRASYVKGKIPKLGVTGQRTLRRKIPIILLWDAVAALAGKYCHGVSKKGFTL